MKKVQTNKVKKLTLGKLTVANLDQSYMRFFRGGNDTIPTPTPTPTPTNTLPPANPNGDILTYNESLINEPNNPCGTSKPKRNGI